MKVIILGWLSICRRILTLDNLRRGMIVVNACLTCLREEESVDHLMVNCKTAQYIWNAVVKWFDCCWVFPNPLSELFKALKAPTGALRGKELWSLTFLAVHWTIWKERYSRCFEGAAISETCLVKKVKFLVALWLSISPSFSGYSIKKIMLHVKELAFSFAGPN